MNNFKYAKHLQSGESIETSPEYKGGKAVCPLCEKEVIPHCGLSNAWHWQHKSTIQCDSWHETSEWHISWQSLFPEEHREVIIERSKKRHRTDAIVLASGQVIERRLIPTGKDDDLKIEFQHSAISPAEMKEREEFYQNMIWVFDCTRDSPRQSRPSIGEVSNRYKRFIIGEYAERMYGKITWSGRHPQFMVVGNVERWLDTGDLIFKVYDLNGVWLASNEAVKNRGDFLLYLKNRAANKSTIHPNYFLPAAEVVAGDQDTVATTQVLVPKVAISPPPTNENLVSAKTMTDVKTLPVPVGPAICEACQLSVEQVKEIVCSAGRPVCIKCRRRTFKWMSLIEENPLARDPVSQPDPKGAQISERTL